MTRGEVWWVQLPAASGREQAGQRPGIIMQEDRFIQSLPLVLMIPTTSEMSATHYDGTLLLQPDQDNGLTKSSVALVFQTRGLDQRRFLRQMGRLDEDTFDRLLEILAELIGR